MKPVWNELKKANVEREAIDKLKSRQCLSTYGIPTRILALLPVGSPNRISLQDEALAAFFVAAVIELSFDRPIWTRSQIAKSVSRAIIDNKPDHPLADPERWSSAYIVDRSSKARGNDEHRCRLRALAYEMHKIYGSFNYGTVANVATVALRPPRPFTKSDVQKALGHPQKSTRKTARKSARFKTRVHWGYYQATI